MDSDTDETRTIEVEVDEWTAERIRQLAWEHESAAEDVARQCCQYGMREYENALSG